MPAKEGETRKLISIYFVHFLLAQKTNQKMQPDHIGPPTADVPHFKKIDGRCETRCAQTVLALFPAIFSKLGKVMMGF
jgi:hypothetical protein